MEIELDNDWIGNYEKKELEYHDFYKDDIKYIKIYSLFVNDNLALENIKKETIFFEEKNLLKKQQLLSIIKTLRISLLFDKSLIQSERIEFLYSSDL